MRYVDEFRDAERCKRLLTRIHRVVTRPWVLMEVCGGQTHSILRSGLDQMLPAQVELVHGPGCPVCVTPVEAIDQALLLASQPGFILATYGDMMRVPGSAGDLLQTRASGGDVRVVYGPLDAVAMAQRHPERQVVFFAVGFETTAPATALAVKEAGRLGLSNFSVLLHHVCVPPAMKTLLSSGDNRVQAFLAAGHVCAVMGTEVYREISETYQVPIVVAGFEPADLLYGILRTVEALESGQVMVENCYGRAVRAEGNLAARQLIAEVFERADRPWRGFGVLPEGGLALRTPWHPFDATRHLPPSRVLEEVSSECRAAEVLRGRMKPTACPAFGTRCTPDHPLGAPMVSGEGACSAFYRYRA